MRLFIAINFGDATKNALLALRDELRSRAEFGDFSLPENLHLTLVFIGECTAKQVSLIKTAMDAANSKPFGLLIDRVGRFGRGSEQGEALWWAGVRGDKALLDLQRDLTDRLAAAGFSVDRRKYSPHITLGRRVVVDTAPWLINPFGENICKIDLMKSERINGKLTYTSIYGVNLR